MNESAYPVEILLAEPRPEEGAARTRAVLDELRVRNLVREVHDGGELAAYLRREAGHEVAPRPDLMLVDVELPGLDLEAFLAELRSGDTAGIPVALLAPDEAARPVAERHGLPADCYIVRPLDPAKLTAMLRCVEAFWISVLKVPPPPED